MLRILRLMNAQVIQEQCKVSAPKFLSDLVDEGNIQETIAEVCDK